MYYNPVQQTILQQVFTTMEECATSGRRTVSVASMSNQENGKVLKVSVVVEPACFLETELLSSNCKSSITELLGVNDKSRVKVGEEHEQ